MSKKPSYEKIQQKINALEKQVIEFKESEAALRDSERHYRDLYENAPIAYFSINRNDGSILRFKPIDGDRYLQTQAGRRSAAGV